MKAFQIILLISTLLFFSACSEQFDIADDPLMIKTIVFGTELDERGVIVEAKSEFSPNEKTIYAIVELGGVYDAVDVTGHWIYVPFEKEFAITTIPAAPLRELVRFDLSSPKPWPVGEYRLDVEVMQGKQTTTGSAAFRVMEE